MNAHIDKTQEDKSHSTVNDASQVLGNRESAFQFIDKRLEAVTQRKLQEMARNGPQSKQVAQLQSMADRLAFQKPQSIQRIENNTGLPDNLKTGMESLSGISLDDVKVHRNSDKPAQLAAYAYAQGSDIHLASGQEKHLPHEAWHVVQQKQGRVKPTMQMKGKININDDERLEREADAMGGKALQIMAFAGQNAKPDTVGLQTKPSRGAQVQRIRIRLDDAADPIMNNVGATAVPKPGTIHQDGFRNYQADHPCIEDNENIVLEGHGTYLNDDHEERADYDSQAYLTPRQLANVAFIVPKSSTWAGQIILFGCHTGPLTMAVSQHYFALSKKSVNVVGTLADIEMEVPGSLHSDTHVRPEHTAEYGEGHDGFPRAPRGAASARTQFRKWLDEVGKEASTILRALQEFDEIINDEERNAGRGTLSAVLMPCLQNLGEKVLNSNLNYQGQSYGASGINMNRLQIDLVREMVSTVIPDVLIFEESLRHPSTELSHIDESAAMLGVFFLQLMTELGVLEGMATFAEASYPAGTVDWEGGNVINSRADKADEVPVEPLPRDQLSSDRWGGGGQVLVLQQVLEPD